MTVRSIVHRSALVAALVTCAAIGAAEAQRAEAPPAQYSPAEAAYSVGFDLGGEVAARLAEDGVDADLDALVKGFNDALRRQDPEINPDRMRRILERIHAEVAGRIAEQRMQNDPVFRALAESNAKRGADLREQFSKRERIVVLPGGVMYEALRTGDGQPAADAESVVVTYETMHADGTPIASQRAAEFRIVGLLDGAQALVRQMRVGDRWFIIVPPDRAYGLGGREPDIGPNETIIVDIELLGVVQ